MLATEFNECGTTLGDLEGRMTNVTNVFRNITPPLTNAQQMLVAQKQRLLAEGMHECPCARQGRLSIINGTSTKKAAQLSDFSNVQEEWGPAYTKRVQVN